MAVAWFAGPYVRDDVAGHGNPTRFFIAADFFEQLLAAGGTWNGPAEILGNYGLLRVVAGQGVLDAIAALAGVERIPKDRLGDQLAAQQRLRDFALELGYTVQEINARLPNLIGTYTLGDVLRFLGSRWRRYVWNGVDIVQEPIDRQPPATVDLLGI